MSPPPPQQKPAAPPFSPAAYSNAASPPNAPSPYGPPPAKRPRLSPDARSPVNGAAAYQTPPYGLYGNPYAPQATAPSPYGSPGPYAQSPQSFHTPQYNPQWGSQPPTPAPLQHRQMSPTGAPPQQQQMAPREMMPPPPRPNKDDAREERANIEDIGDSVYGSGIDLKAEEAWLHKDFGQRDSFATGASTSFGSSQTLPSPDDSFHVLTQPTSFGSHHPAFAGTLGQPRTPEQIDAEDRRKRAEAARHRNERRQHHMSHQFLATNAVRKRLMDRAGENGVMVNTSGLWQRQPSTTATSVLTGAQAGIAAVDTRPEFTATRGDHFEQLMSLISIASGERLRGLVDEAFALSRARRYGDHGRVPPEFAEIATGKGEVRPASVVPESVTGTQWDKTPETDGPEPRTTHSYSSAVAAQLRSLAAHDRAAEEARLAKRLARQRAAEAAAPAPGSDEAAAAAAAAAAGAGLDSGAEADLPKISKKEQARKEKEAKNAREEASHSTTNQTAAMMALGKKGNRYSWMSGGAGGAALKNRYKASPAPGGSGAATPKRDVKEEAAASPVGGGAVGEGKEAEAPGPKVVEWGDWTEVGDRGVQVRDWVRVLERDRRCGDAVQRIWNGLR